VIFLAQRNPFMHYRRCNQRYALLIQSSQSCGVDWQSSKINMIVAKTHWSPFADVYETNEKIYVTIEIAGIDLEKLEISLYEDALVAEGKRLLPPISSKGMYHMAEIRQGSFCFELPLNVSVKPEQVETKYENGLLSIVIKK
jgi:HSP20 family molecular chaperone IbpA